jgi:BASS family bile acid:Na+ symporter
VLGYFSYQKRKTVPEMPLWIRIAGYITSDPSTWLLFGTLFGYLFWKSLENSRFTGGFSYYLMLSLFVMGLSIMPADWKRVAKNPKVVLLTFLTVWIVMPATAFFLGKTILGAFLPLEVAQMLTAGMVLLGTTPTGTASNTLTYISKGDLATSITVTSISTIMTPLLQPLLVTLLLGDMIPMDTPKIMMDLVKMVVIPIAAGSILGAVLPKQIARIKPVLAPIAIISLSCVMMSTMSKGTGTLIAHSRILPYLVIALALLGLIGMSAGYFGTKYLYKFDEASARMATYEVGIQNAALTSGIALIHFTPLTALPAILFGKLQNLMASMIFVPYLARQDEKKAAEGEEEIADR